MEPAVFWPLFEMAPGQLPTPMRWLNLLYSLACAVHIIHASLYCCMEASGVASSYCVSAGQNFSSHTVNPDSGKMYHPPPASTSSLKFLHLLSLSGSSLASDPSLLLLFLALVYSSVWTVNLRETLSLLLTPLPSSQKPCFIFFRVCTLISWHSRYLCRRKIMFNFLKQMEDEDESKSLLQLVQVCFQNRKPFPL